MKSQNGGKFQIRSYVTQCYTSQFVKGETKIFFPCFDETQLTHTLMC